VIDSHVRLLHDAREQRQFFVIPRWRFVSALDANHDKENPLPFQVGVVHAVGSEQFNAPHLKILKEPAVMKESHRIHFRIANSNRDRVFSRHCNRHYRACRRRVDGGGFQISDFNSRFAADLATAIGILNFEF
jgi:hypothetical protein